MAHLPSYTDNEQVTEEWHPSIIKFSIFNVLKIILLAHKKIKIADVYSGDYYVDGLISIFSKHPHKSDDSGISIL